MSLEIQFSSGAKALMLFTPYGTAKAVPIRNLPGSIAFLAITLHVDTALEKVLIQYSLF
jgi:hypothetical protein